jgi:Family of unknown function (DUF5309)
MATNQNTYNAVGNREDLSDVIYDISPTTTPFLSGVAHTTATATNHEWQTDSIGTASASNAVVEGADATHTAAVPSVRLGNLTQISDKVPSVTRTQRKVDSAGRGDELDYQIMKFSKLLKNDMESALLSNKAKVAGDAAAVARELAGIESWLSTNTQLGVGGVAPLGDGTDVRTGGANLPLDEATLKTLLSDIYNTGGDPDMIMVNPFNKQAMSGFVGGGTSGPAQRMVDGTTTTVNTAFDVYVSDFGSMKVVPNRFQVAESMLVLQMDMWAVAFIDNFIETPLAKTGDADQVQIISEYTLQARNQAASGIYSDLTTA